MRTYPVPRRVLDKVEVIGPLTASAAAGAMTTDQLEQAAALMPGTDLGAWAQRTIEREATSQLERLGFDPKHGLPVAVLSDKTSDDDVAIGLAVPGRTLTSSGWKPIEMPGDRVDLNVVDAAFVASALADGTIVVLRPWHPVAMIAAVAPTTDSPASTSLPDGAIAVAIVDELDKTAVLELVAVAPGPIVYRRHDGEWREDPEWLKQLRSVRPPHMVRLDDAQITDVERQVDEATAGQPFSKEETPSQAGSGSPWASEHSRYADALAVDLALIDADDGAMIAAPTPKGAASAERLRQYWMNGEGAAKIRWGAPGDWKRCVRQLTKHLGVRAKGYCSLLHARKLGQWAGSKRGHGVKDPRVVAQAIAKQRAR